MGGVTTKLIGTPITSTHNKHIISAVRECKLFGNMVFPTFY